jgi:ABC-2 type transport system permease protein
MRGFLAVFKRELKAYFTTPVAYVFLVVFLFFAGYLPFREGWYANRQADMRLFFQMIPLLFLFLVPCAAMRLWAEERRSGTIELLLSLPITVTQAALGKFFAAWLFLLIALVLTAPFAMTVEYLGEPDWGHIVLGYVGSFLMAGSFLAIGCFFSAMTKNQVISFILTVVASAMLVFAGMPETLSTLETALPGGLVDTVELLGMGTHFDSISRGVLALTDVVYFTIMIVGWMLACVILLQERKAA